MDAGDQRAGMTVNGTDEPNLIDMVAPLVERWRLLLIIPSLVALIAAGATFLITPVFTAQTTLLPPQQQQSAAASALASLGALANIAGAGSSIRTPADQYVALMQSATVSDRIIERFKLMSVYDETLRVDARRQLAKSVRIVVGKKDGLISIEVEDINPQRSADIANAYVEELRRLTGTLAVTEAQQRRAFFEKQLEDTRDKLVRAQSALQSSGFGQGALRAEPRAAADAYARLRAETTAAEIRLQTLRGAFANNSPEILTQQSTLTALRAQLERAEQATEAGDGPDYIGKYREFKYQEALFDMFARQFELARIDESREGALIQVIDVATPPEKKSKPKRLLIVAGAAIGSLIFTVIGLIMLQNLQGLNFRNDRK
jgi:uncharacterized protein involved in exopolysaccharide biosynthesis